MKIFMIAGEASGDMQGAMLTRALIEQDPSVEIEGWGGELMRAEGVTIRKDLAELAFMGFVEVLKHLGKIRQNFKDCKKQILEMNPDRVVFIDYPGFNLRMAKWVKEQGIPNSYYISPQAWAWKEGRVQKIKKFIDQMICILPFEVDFYAKHDYAVQYVGHPLLQRVDDFIAKHDVDSKDFLALLPGSRKQEVANNLPAMLQCLEGMDDIKSIAIAKSPTLDAEFYGAFLEAYPHVKLWEEGSYGLLQRSKAALVTSGTATLETALFSVPQIVCYQADAVSVRLARYFIKVPYISLVNLILDRPLLREMIQKDFNRKNIQEELNNILTENASRRTEILSGYDELRGLLYEGAPAADLAAKIILEASKK